MILYYILYYTILHYTILYYTLPGEQFLYYTILYYTIVYYINNISWGAPPQNNFLMFYRATASEAPRGPLLIIICCLNRYCFERPLRYSIV